MNFKEQVLEWARDGFDREEGIALFSQKKNNPYYMGNLRRKPLEPAIRALKYELFYITGIKVEEMDAVHANWKKENDPPVELTELPAAPKFIGPVQDKEDLMRLAKNATVASSWAQFGPRNDLREAVKKISSEDFENAYLAKPDKEVSDTVGLEALKDSKFQLRKEFPFLDNKDCPDEFEDIVQEMVTGFYRYKKKHLQLHDVDPRDNTACFDASKGVVEPYLQNRECWKELNHYKTHGKVLGEHPAFARRARLQELKGMSTYDLTVMLKSNIGRNIKYNNSCLERYANSPKRAEWREKISNFEQEELWVKNILRDRGELPAEK